MNLRTHRLGSGLSQTELAIASAVPRYVISLAEHAAILPPREIQERIASALGASVKQLFGPTPDEPAES